MRGSTDMAPDRKVCARYGAESESYTKSRSKRIAFCNAAAPLAVAFTVAVIVSESLRYTFTLSNTHTFWISFTTSFCISWWLSNRVS